jgi:hypothetical protein
VGKEKIIGLNAACLRAQNVQITMKPEPTRSAPGRFQMIDADAVVAGHRPRQHLASDVACSGAIWPRKTHRLAVEHSAGTT